MPQTAAKLGSTWPQGRSLSTSATPSTSETPKANTLYHHRHLDAFECMGCHEFFGVPRTGILTKSGRVEAIATNPENRLIWLELMTLDHERCHLYGDAKQAQDARTFRKKTIQRKPQLPVFRPA